VFAKAFIVKGLIKDYSTEEPCFQWKPLSQKFGYLETRLSRVSHRRRFKKAVGAAACAECRLFGIKASDLVCDLSGEMSQRGSQ